MSRPSHSPLSRLSNRGLTRSLQRLVSDERRQLVEILDHLNEFERRKLHLELGFSSLYDYCVRGLCYSRSAADRRIVTARVLRRFPEVAAILTSGDASLTTVSMIARLLTPANGHMMLEHIRGKSQRQVELIVDEHLPETRTRDRVRSISVRERVKPAVEPGIHAGIEPGVRSGVEPGANPEVEPRVEPNATPEPVLPHGHPGAGNADTPALRPAGGGGTAAPLTAGGPPLVVMVQKHEIKFIAGKGFMKKVERMKALLTNRASHTTFEQVFEVAMECYLERHCPERRHDRRHAKAHNAKAHHVSEGEVMARDVKEEGASDNRNCGTAAAKADVDSRPLPAPGVARARNIPAAVRDAVHVRDGGRCTFVGPGGRRCGTRRHLHIDHIVPFALGGGHEPSNLRLLCRAHNLLAAEHAFGREAMTGHSRQE